MSLTTGGKPSQTARLSFAKSQLILFQSRKKFSLLYCLATVTGLFCMPGAFGQLSMAPTFLVLVQTFSLPVASLLVTAGTYVLNDLVDADLDRANGKKRPIPSGQVSAVQARMFVLLTFGTALSLTAATLSLVSLFIVTTMLAIGIAYSAPRIALMKRFVIKTVSIAVFYMLCALLGLTSPYNLDQALTSPIVVSNVLLTLALMVFISSTLNDMGDVEGDKKAGRRTIPIVLGSSNTIKLTIFLAITVLAVTWGFCAASLILGKGNPIAAITTTSVASIVLVTLCRIRNRTKDMQFARSQHRRMFPLQIAMHPSIIVGLMI